jgi:elongation factor P
VAISINQLKTGLTIVISDVVYQIINLQHVKPGKGAAFVRSRLKNMKIGTLIDRTFRGDEKIEEAFVEEKKLQYLYHKDNLYHFMDQKSFEELILDQNILKDNISFLKDNLEVTALICNQEILNINLPNFINLRVEYTEPGTKGDTVKAGTKLAKLESGAEIQVPLFVDSGNIIKVDTRTKQYVERVNI